MRWVSIINMYSFINYGLIVNWVAFEDFEGVSRAFDNGKFEHSLLSIYDSFGLVFGWGDDGFVIYL